MEKSTKNYIQMFQDAKNIRDIDLMSEIFNEMAAEAGIRDDAAKGKRLAEMRNSREHGTRFEGSVPGKKF
jgi:hypothetical protein